MNVSKWFYPGKFTDEQMREAQRSPLWPVALSMMCVEEMSTLSVYAAWGDYNTKKIALALPDGFVPFVLIHHMGKYTISTVPDPAVYAPSVSTPVMTSNSLRYIMRRLAATENSGLKMCINHTKGTARTIGHAVAHAVHQIKMSLEPKETASTFSLRSDAQEWAVRLALGGAQKIAVPPKAMEQIEKLWTYYDTCGKVFDNYIAKIQNLIGGEKYVIAHIKQGYSERWIIGVINGDVYVDILKARGDTYYKPEAFSTQIPFQAYNTIGELDDAMYEKTGRRIRGKLTMLKLSRGTAAACDSDGYIPSVTKVIRYEDTGSVAWNMGWGGSPITWFMFDKE